MSLDVGLCGGNYFDYSDDELALQREYELADSIGASNSFKDEAFPPNARSLYFDPLNPPKGSLPNEAIRWFSISDGDIVGCENPVLFKGDILSPLIEKGALGNSYLINAFSLLACNPALIKTLMVSNRYASQGLYTFKFYKAGKWRYVHVDDLIPCRPSGRIHFCRNHNSNETFAILLEKAYAKLHGCYEAISGGLLEKALQELTAGASVQTIRTERMKVNEMCDDVWDALDESVRENKLIGCGRFIPDDIEENPQTRCGITLVTSSQPTEKLDALTIGMVCIRNLQKDKGNFIGRWSYGNKLWNDYKEIAFDVRHRTRELQFKRGLGPDPNKTDEVSKNSKGLDSQGNVMAINDDDFDADDEPDNLDTTYIDKFQAIKMVQPDSCDLYWIQIEDFVEIFNRIYILTDLSHDKNFLTKRFLSKWVPGDFISGSGGPPIVITTEPTVIEVEADDLDDDNSSIKSKGNVHNNIMIQKPMMKRIPIINENFTDNPMYPFTVTERTTMTIILYQLDKRWNISRLGDTTRDLLSNSFANRSNRLSLCMQYNTGIGFLVVRLNGLKFRLTEFRLRKVIAKSEGIQFSNMVSTNVTLRPGRYAIIPFTHRPLDRAIDYVIHTQIISKHVDFEIEDVVKQRLSDNIPSDDEGDEDMPEDNELLVLNNNIVELKNDDNNNDNNNDKKDNNNNEDILGPSDEISLLSYQMVNDDDDENDENSIGINNVNNNKRKEKKIFPQIKLTLPPKYILFNRWEYEESLEEIGLNNMFLEIFDISKYVKNLRNEVRKLNGTIKAITTLN
eukprot:gene13241-17747_t